MLQSLRLTCDGTRAETRFRLSAKRTSPFKSAGTSVQSTTGSRVVRISGSNVGFTTFRGSVKGTGYPLHSPVSPSLPPCASPCAITFQLDSTFGDGSPATGTWAGPEFSAATMMVEEKVRAGSRSSVIQTACSYFAD